jgi:type I restriction enzyme, S subunit
MNATPSHWTRAPLENVGVWRGGGTPSKSHLAYWSGGTMPWVSPKDMKQAVIETAIDKVTDRAVTDTGLDVIPAGSILLVTRSGILARMLPVGLTTVPVVINQDLKALTPVADVDPAFLQHQLIYLQPEILSQALKPGTTVESIEFAALRRFEVALPPLAEQQAIARRLTAINQSLASARAQLQSVLTLLDAYKRAMLIRALSGRWDETRPARDVTLGEIADVQSGLALGKRYAAAKLVSRPYLRVANVQRGRLDLEDVRDVLVPASDAKKYQLAKGDILMNEGGDRDKLGRGWVWGGEVAKCLHQNHVFRVRLHDEAFPPEFISHFANELGRDYFLSEAKQTTNLASISKGRLSSLPIRLPSADDARAALEFYEEQTLWTNGARSQVLAALAETDAAQAAAAGKAFSGRLVPSLSNAAPPVLFGTGALERPARVPRPRTPPLEKGLSMNTLTEMLKGWPKEGLTFEAVREQMPADYETLKDAIFNLLAGDEPQLEQRYNEGDRAMRFFRVAA